MTKTLLLVVNDPQFFVSHRLAVAEGARDEGYAVHVATRAGEAVTVIKARGFVHHELPLTRSGQSIAGELRALLSIWRLLWRLRPEIVHLVTIKPVLYGGIAARLAPVGSVVAAVSGLGFVFLSAGIKAAVRRAIVKVAYRFALGKRRLKVIFQNPDDRDLVRRLVGLPQEKVEMIRGSGVDLARYVPCPEPEGDPLVCLAARLLHDKGVVEFVEAARLLRADGVKARFRLIGDIDPDNPATISDRQLEAWQKEGVVEILGHRNDIPALFSEAHIVVLPSYREGLPKVLLEAAACGRAVVTCDVPGCRDAIEPGVTGILAPVRDQRALADALRCLIEEPHVRQRMGRAGRELAEREFAIQKIVQQHLAIYRKLDPI